MNIGKIQELQLQVCIEWVSHLGQPYRWGSMDCSHLMVHGHQKFKTWPGDYMTASQMFHSNLLVRIPWEERQPADIVGFGDPDTGDVHHVVGVLLNGMIGANKGSPPLPGETPAIYAGRQDKNGAMVKLCGNGYWASHRVGVRRVPMLDHHPSEV